MREVKIKASIYEVAAFIRIAKAGRVFLTDARVVKIAHNYDFSTRVLAGDER